MMYRLTCEYSRFSLLLAFRNVLPTSLAARCMQGVTAVFAGYLNTVPYRPRAYPLYASVYGGYPLRTELEDGRDYEIESSVMF